MKNLFFLVAAFLVNYTAQSQATTPVLYISSKIMSGEKILVSVKGTKTIEGNVVSAELNGKKTETKTDNKGRAVLNVSTICSGLANPAVVVVKVSDKKGKLIMSANTTVEVGNTITPARPVMEPLPSNIEKGAIITIRGAHLGTEAKLNCSNQEQETLAASDKEMTVLNNANTGSQSVFVVTPNGVSESQKVNVYSLDFSLPKSSIKPKENIQAMVHYESIPEGTKLIFTNVSPQTVKMNIPGAVNTASECVYEVKEQNGTIPVNITGITRGSFKIVLNLEFKK